MIKVFKGKPKWGKTHLFSSKRDFDIMVKIQSKCTKIATAHIL